MLCTSIALNMFEWLRVMAFDKDRSETFSFVERKGITFFLFQLHHTLLFRDLICCPQAGHYEKLFERRRLSWEDAAAFEHQGQRYSWLGVRTEPFALGCRACKAFGMQCRWGEYKVSHPIKQTVKNHCQSAKHRRSIQAAMSDPQLLKKFKLLPDRPLSDSSSGLSRVSGPWKPEAHEFESAGSKVRKPADGAVCMAAPSMDASSPRHHLLGRKRKAEIELDRLGQERPQEWLLNHKKLWTMAEAQKEVWRSSFVPGCCASIAHDKRQSDILILFQTCHPDTLESTRGVLGLERNVKGSAASIKAALNRSLRRFCTQDCDAPSLGPVGNRDATLERTVREAIKGVCADGCPADQKALKDMADDGKSLPECKDRSRDKAHSLRSCLRRPCLRMSPSAQSIMNAILLGKKSAVRLIDNSDGFKEMWLEASQKVPDPMPGRRCNMGFAPQRFESEARPLASIALLPERFLMTCLGIANDRAGREEGQLMAKHLTLIDNKALILTAVQADAVNEGLKLIRELDRFRLESEKLSGLLDEFRITLHSLFGEHGAAWCPRKSKDLLVSDIYSFLEHPRVLRYQKTTKVIGGKHFTPQTEEVVWVKKDRGLGHCANM